MSEIRDLDHWCGADIGLDAASGLQLAAPDDRLRQRLVRRLMTAPGGAMFHPEFGCGLPAMIGAQAPRATIIARVMGQVLAEPDVARSPAPTVEVVGSGADASTLVIRIAYTQRSNGRTDVLDYSARAG
jgi:hypothetical protein